MVDHQQPWETCPRIRLGTEMYYTSRPLFAEPAMQSRICTRPLRTLELRIALCPFLQYKVQLLQPRRIANLGWFPAKYHLGYSICDGSPTVYESPGSPGALRLFCPPASGPRIYSHVVRTYYVRVRFPRWPAANPMIAGVELVGGILVHRP